MATLTLTGTTEVLVDVPRALQILERRIAAGVKTTADRAYARARADVPVRQVFAIGRNKLGNPIRGRQDVRQLSISEALGQQGTTKELFLQGLSGAARAAAIQRGVGTPFPTDRAGRRIRGSNSNVNTAQISDTYRSRNRANPGIDDDVRRNIAFIHGQKHIVGYEDVDPTSTFQVRGEVRTATTRRPIQRKVPLLDVEADLSSQGRYELKRADTSAASAGGSSSLGGALRRSITVSKVQPGRIMTARISAGNDKVDYAKYVEFGTRRSRAQPFLRPALAQAREEFAADLRAALSGGELLRKDD